VPKNIIIIPGLGDRMWSYRLILPLWRTLGYRVYLHRFGWNDDTSYHTNINQLHEIVRSFSDDGCSIIGCSAGGTAAINALVTNPNIVMSVVTVATPYYDPNQRLRRLPRRIRLGHLVQSGVDSYGAISDPLNNDLLKKITAISGLYDQLVSTKYSTYYKIKKKRIPVIGHGPIIAASMTLYRKKLCKLL
jgi:pimeloyl-ACP methyl ester carboxylesterase